MILTLTLVVWCCDWLAQVSRKKEPFIRLNYMMPRRSETVKSRCLAACIPNGTPFLMKCITFHQGPLTSSALYRKRGAIWDTDLFISPVELRNEWTNDRSRLLSIERHSTVRPQTDRHCVLLIKQSIVGWPHDISCLPVLILHGMFNMTRPTSL